MIAVPGDAVGNSRTPDGRYLLIADGGNGAIVVDVSVAAGEHDPAHALLAAVRVGEAPVGLAIIHGGRDVVVADSNRFPAAGAGGLPWTHVQRLPRLVDRGAGASAAPSWRCGTS